MYQVNSGPISFQDIKYQVKEFSRYIRYAKASKWFRFSRIKIANIEDQGGAITIFSYPIQEVYTGSAICLPMHI